jgi:hypothetical protein
MRKLDKFFIDGRWVGPSGDDIIEVVNPATEEVIASVPEGTPEDVDAAVRAARTAFDGWAARPVVERAAFLEKISEGLKQRGEEIAMAITEELGMPLKLSQAIQAGLPAVNMGLFADLAKGHVYEERIGDSLVVREPVGVVGSITPWNFPLPAPGRGQGRPGPGGRLHRGSQAERSGADRCFYPDGDYRTVRSSGRGLQSGGRIGIRGRRGPGQPFRSGHGFFYRFDPGRPPGSRTGLPDGQALRPGTGGEISGHRSR